MPKLRLNGREPEARRLRRIILRLLTEKLDIVRDPSVIDSFTLSIPEEFAAATPFDRVERFVGSYNEKFPGVLTLEEAGRE